MSDRKRITNPEIQVPLIEFRDGTSDDVDEGGASGHRRADSGSDPGRLRSHTSPELREELNRFVQDADKTAHKIDLKSAFYHEENLQQPQRHHVDEEDYRSHRGIEFPHVSHLMSLHQPSDWKKSHRHRRHSQSQDTGTGFQPTLEDVQESTLTQEEGLTRNVMSAPDLESTKFTGSQVKVDQSADNATKSGEVKIYLGDTGESSTDQVDERPAYSNVGFYIGDPSSGSGEGHTSQVDPGHLGFLSNLGQHDKSDASLQRVQTPEVTFHLGSTGSIKKEDPEQPNITVKPPSQKHSSRSSKPERHGHRHHGHRHHGHHHHHHHGTSEADLLDRRKLGSEVGLKEDPIHKVPTEEEEAITLNAFDLDEMSSHRLSDPKGIRRRRISHPRVLSTVVHINKADKKGTKKVPSKFDHSPHELFVELDELYLGDNQEFEWQEKARWIKFEEDLEEGAERWGKPHVASLSFHSLLELRRTIEQGVMLLDSEAEDLPSIVNQVVDQMVAYDQLPAEQRGAVIKALLLKHRHVNEQNFIRRNLSHLNLLATDSRRSIGLLRNQSTSSMRESSNKQKYIDRKMSMPASMDQKVDNSNRANGKDHLKLSIPEKIDVHAAMAEQPSTEEPIPATLRHDKQILRHIPKDAEATTVLVGSVDFLDQPITAFVRLSRGRYLGNLTEVPLPVRFLFILMGPVNAGMDYHEIGRSISTLMAHKGFHDIAYRADDRQDILTAINEFLDDSMVLPPGDWDRKTLLPIMDMARKKALAKKRKRVASGDDALQQPAEDPLQRTGKLFGGLIRDMKRRYPKYVSDLKDGLNFQCLAASIFIYFAALSPAVTFGGLLSDKTEKLIGVTEALLATSVFGVIFALFAGQPLNILGVTGPTVIFEEALFQFAGSFGLEYLTLRCWSLFWMSLICFIMVMLEGSVLVKYFTRFTEEIFATLISLIFIYEVFRKLYVIFAAHPLQANYQIFIPPANESLTLGTTPDYSINVTLSNASSSSSSSNDSSLIEALLEAERLSSQPNTALLSLILTFGTFFFAYFLKNFRNSKFLGRSARRALGDFGIPLAIFIMVLVDYLIEETYTEKLDVPDGVQPTDSSQRGWFINPLGMEQGVPAWVCFATAIPALLVFILVFMESQITSIIVNKKDNKLKKSPGYHLDLLLLGVFSVISGLFGLPIMCLATVRSVTHVSALTQFSTTQAPGEKPKVIGLIEQRITAIAVSILIGVSVLMGPILRTVPVAVLFGVFLYMGVASLSGIQFTERLELLFTPVKHHPDVAYVRKVRTSKMHLYTLIQLGYLAILWAVKSTKAALAFPFFVIMAVPVRSFLLKWIFSIKELVCLDNDGVDMVDKEEEEPDFYETAHMPQ